MALISQEFKKGKERRESRPPIMCTFVVGALSIVAFGFVRSEITTPGCAFAFQCLFSCLISSFDKMSVFKTRQKGQKMHQLQGK